MAPVKGQGLDSTKWNGERIIIGFYQGETMLFALLGFLEIFVVVLFLHQFTIPKIDRISQTMIIVLIQLMGDKCGILKGYH